MTSSIRTFRRAAGALASATVLTICVGVNLGSLACLHPGSHRLVARCLPGGGNELAATRAHPAAPGDGTTNIAHLTTQALQLCHDNEWSQNSVDILDRFLRKTGNLEPIAGELLRRADTIPPEARAVIFRTLARRALAERELTSTEAAPRPLREVVERRLDITF